MNWYDNLNKSKLTPPPYVFPIVWSFLYLTIAVSLGINISAGGLNNKWGITFFILQLLLNISWSPVFFKLRQPGKSLLIVIGMLVFISLTIREFLKTSPISGYILLPYLIWVSLATYLNAYIWWYN